MKSLVGNIVYCVVGLIMILTILSTTVNRANLLLVKGGKSALDHLVIAETDQEKYSNYRSKAQSYLDSNRTEMALLYVDSALVYAKKNNSVNDQLAVLNMQLDILMQLNDTSAIAKVFENSDHFRGEYQNYSTNREYIKFRINRQKYLLRYSKVAIDEILNEYKEIYEVSHGNGYHDICAEVLGKISTTYRSKRKLGKAFEYNQKELIEAKLSDDSFSIAKALITELDLAYNSLPWPIETKDLESLVEKGQFASRYMKEKGLRSILPFSQLYLAKFYIKQENYKEAESLLKDISETESLNVTFSKYEHLCEIAKLTNNLEDYRTYAYEFKPLAYSAKRPFVSLNVHNYLLDYYLKVENPDSTFYYANRLEVDISLVDTTKYLDYLDVSYKVLARYFEGADPVKGLSYLASSNKIGDIIIKNQRETFTAVMKYKSELDTLQQENILLVKSNSGIRNNLTLFIGLFIVLAICLFVLYKKYSVSKTTVEEVMQEKNEMVEKVERIYLELNNKQRVYLDELRYLKSDRNYVEFYTAEKSFLDRNKLSSVLKQLPPNFVRVHRSFIVNKNFIKSSSSTQLLLSPNHEVPISRTFKENLSFLK